MTEHGRFVVVALLVFASFASLLRGPPRAQPPGPWEAAPPCPVPVERAGEGLLCLDEAEAERAGLQAGDRLLPDGGVGRMAPERLELAAAPLDLNAAPVEELASLPNVGPRLAERIAAARPFSTVDELRRVPGIGPKRLAALAARLRIGPGPADP